MRLVYADVVLAINFVSDFTALYITSKLSGLYIKKSKLIASSFLGAVFSLFLMILNPPRLIQLTLSLCICFLIVLTAFGKKRLSVIIKLVITLNASGILMAGFVTVFINKINSLNAFVIMLLCFMLLIMLIKVFRRFLISDMKSKTVRIFVKTSVSEGVFHVLSDSGNVLTDPLSGLYVVVLTLESKKLLIGEAAESYKNNQFRMIPIMTAGGVGCLDAIKPETVYIIDEKETLHRIDVIVAFASSEKVTFCDRDGIIPQLLIDNI